MKKLVVLAPPCSLRLLIAMKRPRSERCTREGWIVAAERYVPDVQRTILDSQLTVRSARSQVLRHCYLKDFVNRLHMNQHQTPLPTLKTVHLSEMSLHRTMNTFKHMQLPKSLRNPHRMSYILSMPQMIPSNPSR
jgi:hypothetical protein